MGWVAVLTTVGAVAIVLCVVVAAVMFVPVSDPEYLWVDYNELYWDSGSAYYDHVSVLPEPVGTRIMTGDYEGNRCMAVINYRGQHITILRMEMNTFRPHD